TITGSTTNGAGCSARKSATVSITSAENSIPVFTASTPMSPKTASSCARTNSGGTSWTAVTPTVFCAVSATTALIPWHSAAAKAFRSAWIPAPPPESEPAIVKHLGTTGDEASIVPGAIVTWGEPLQGEGVAYRTEIPARRADVVPIPDGLHPRVIDSLAGLGLD